MKSPWLEDDPLLFGKVTVTSRGELLNLRWASVFLLQGECCWVNVVILSVCGLDCVIKELLKF